MRLFHFRLPYVRYESTKRCGEKMRDSTMAACPCHPPTPLPIAQLSSCPVFRPFCLVVCRLRDSRMMTSQVLGAKSVC